MNEIEETLLINNLLDLYGKLLTNKQLEILNDYYEFNLSLSEISENRNISRTAVSDALKIGRNKLLEYEEKLNLNKILNKLEKDNVEVANLIKEEIKDGI